MNIFKIIKMKKVLKEGILFKESSDDINNISVFKRNSSEKTSDTSYKGLAFIKKKGGSDINLNLRIKGKSLDNKVSIRLDESDK